MAPKAPIKKSKDGWFTRFSNFNIESLFASSREPGPPRSVYVNQPLPEDYFNKKGKVLKERKFATNQVITSKYTVITFLPRNLLEQFRRVANCFFLAIAVLQFFPQFSTISPGLVILPLLAVLLITAIKDGYEDIKRHQSDRQVNYSPTHILAGGEYENLNPMSSKARTFVRGLNPLELRKHLDKRKKAKKTTAQQAAIASQSHGLQPASENPHSYTVEDEYESDDDMDGQPGNRDGPWWKKGIWEDVRVGDFVKIKNDEPFPADIVICATSEEENVCYVETKNLDGETNLKSRNAVQSLTHLRTARACADPKEACFRIDADRPDTNMYKLNAAIKGPDGMSPVDIQTVLLRGSVLRNTAWVIGVVLFTGEDSKIVRNSSGTPSKRSKVERQMNPQVLMNLAILGTMAVVCAIVDSSLEKYFHARDAPWEFGANRSDDNPSINGLVTWAFALITFQNIIPISLYISIEFVRTLQAAFIYYDSEITYDKTNQPTLSRSWNLSDDLGQIEYIFSDKTGTLTQNAMVFRHCSVAGKVYKGDPEMAGKTSEDLVSPVSTDNTATFNHDNAKSVPDPANATSTKLPKSVFNHFKDSVLAHDIEDAKNASSDSENAYMARVINGFFNTLALCHTVLAAVDPETGAIEYKAQSPDEAALVQAAADVGFVFQGRDKEILRLRTPFSEQLEEYELLHVLEFTSARKRMSVILKKLGDQDGRIFLLMKGADNVIFERLKPGLDEDIKSMTEHHLEEFANEGLRTLTLGYRVISNEEYEAWSHRYHDATVALDSREEKIEEVSSNIEKDLRLLGATAIEDRLQDGVPEAIADLKRAGIKVWVATGDKLETAIAIGYSTNLIAQDSNLVVIRGGGKNVTDQIINAIEDFFPDAGIEYDRPEKKRPSLSERRASWMRNSMGSRPYPMKRVSTGGMSDVVGRNNGNRPGGFVLVIDGAGLGHAMEDDENKRLLLSLAMQCEGVICCRVSPIQKAQVVRLVKDGLGAMTLAIGDGANDVSMIQAADVGVGISGEEGLQAVNSSDYAIAQFRFLKRLLLVHGHWSYARNANMIVNFFYKNIVCIGVLWWFMIYCGWSTQYVFEYTYLLFWNVFWSLCPVIAIGLFDRVADDDVLMAIPELYTAARQGNYFGLKIFTVYMTEGVYQSVVIFFFVLYTYFSITARADGYDVAMYEFSTVMVLGTVTVANIFNGLNTHAWTGWVFFSVFIGIILVWVYTAIYSLIAPGWFYVPVYGNDHYLFHSALLWFSIPLVFAIALAPRFVAKFVKYNYFPNDIQVLQWIRKTEPHRDIVNDPELGGRYKTQLKKDDIARLDSTLDIRHQSYPSGRVSVDDIGSRPSFDPRRGSRTDMSTGLRSQHRGYDFAHEEGNGPAMRRIQSNLSNRINASRTDINRTGSSRLKPKNSISLLQGSVRRTFNKLKPRPRLDDDETP